MHRDTKAEFNQRAYGIRRVDRNTASSFNTEPSVSADSFYVHAFPFSSHHVHLHLRKAEQMKFNFRSNISRKVVGATCWQALLRGRRWRILGHDFHRHSGLY